ncbi:MAG: 3-deoxy-manno-octulosonate cytidylyltransferase [Rhodospirillaceae bacterium]|nr:3-deoxy-manno-octulosonate cytidylyltransferase [Rhodospirillaceae bacterium]
MITTTPPVAPPAVPKVAPTVAIVIPSRYGSVRFPGKPLAAVAGITMLQRIWGIAQQVQRVSGVYIATDDQRIADHAASFGATVVMTPAECATGTDRVQAVFAQLPVAERPDAVVNFQGDALLTPPWVLQAMVDELQQSPSVGMVTPVWQMSRAQLDQLKKNKESNPSSGTLAVFDKDRNALYFSKAIIPYFRKLPEGDSIPVYRHIGLYGYRLDVLDQLSTLPQTPLEVAEGLEQLRALENGIPIRCVLVDFRGRTHWSVDAPGDVAVAEQLIAREGELVDFANIFAHTTNPA